ncbi:MAG: AAA-like domain-containing protein [Oscillochloridaceae bacterium umkhey_bin13]
MQRAQSSPPPRLVGLLASQDLVLRVCQGAWWAALALVLAFYTVGLPGRIAQLIAVTPYPRGMQLSPLTASYLNSLGIPIPAYFWYVLSLELLTAAIYLGVAMLIFWRRHHELGVVLVSLLLLCYGSTETTFTFEVKNYNPEPWLLLRRILQAAGEWLSLVVFFIFPDGRFVPRWTRWVALAYAIVCLLWLLFPELPFNVTSSTFNEGHPWSYLLLVGIHSLGFVALALRYRQLGDGIERQQIKWAVLGLAIVASAVLIRYTFDPFIILFNLFEVPEERFLFNVLHRPTQWIFLWAFPLGLAFAMLRQRLWAIDPILSRFVAYLLLSGVLLMTVLATSLFLGQILHTELSGGLALAATTTGLIVVLTAHGRMQRWVDRRFNRRRLDAQHALRQFADDLGTTVTPTEVQRLLPERMVELLRLEYSTLLMAQPDGRYAPVSAYGQNDQPLTLDPAALAKLEHGELISHPDTAWPLLLPLRTPQVEGMPSLIGLLAVGPYRSGRPYDHEDNLILQLLADRAASALALAALIEREQQVNANHQLVNPYRPNRPLPAASPLFVGREADLAILAERLGAGAAVVLTGEHRMGKTSLLQQLPSFLGPHVSCVLVDGQRLAVGGNLSTLCHELACALCEAVAIDPPPFAAFQERPDATLLRQILPAVKVAVGERQLVLLLDEFEELERRVQDQQIDRAVLGLLRFVMQHEPSLTLLLVGSSPPEELRHDLWPDLLNTALHHRLEPLAAAAAQQLVTSPLDQQLQYTPAALNQVLALSAGHPYCIHVICSTLVTQANQRAISLVEPDAVAEAASTALELAAPHLVSLWHRSHEDERRILRALADTEPQALAAHAIAERAGLSPSQARNALRRLTRRGLFASSATDEYTWRLGLFQLWVREVAPEG